jgi:hypothetical protein
MRKKREPILEAFFLRSAQSEKDVFGIKLHQEERVLTDLNEFSTLHACPISGRLDCLVAKFFLAV